MQLKMLQRKLFETSLGHTTKKYRKVSASRDISALASKRALITGGNTGIGYETALGLLKKDFEVVLACRDTVKASDAQKKLIAEVPGSKVSTVFLDLTDLSSVRTCAQQLLDSGDAAFDVLLNNAGKDEYSFNHFHHSPYCLDICTTGYFEGDS
ncbi:hypothetical protein CEUSTIGMA_g4223.t1 [Chlamydomonas eustigma]|uniref:Uncharacterized protein n=1 Tax=Chlamydomonas eustigma TaxID=1157962 RepID=A0A250X124_9CHLO|nr:hypothetical protein CEUSTIGMA_g4223.t1 [Chlamydomonas eustigma]|eukprot:GAX76777.1 hypothetical protein CEUSTIGMA_g4223.t1 [Chlamydomonas eustigma]